MLDLLEGVDVLDLHVFFVQAALGFQGLQGMVQREDRLFFSIQPYSFISLRRLSFRTRIALVFVGQSCTRFRLASFAFPINFYHIGRGGRT